ncbi:hypothetical protein LP419_23670 [Massilia sp. H-1]|nr:hypothetical protein LP419_23670 [Massilia sp. H-1]
MLACALAEHENKVKLARADYGAASEILHKTIKDAEGKSILANIDRTAAVTRPLMDKARKLATA